MERTCLPARRVEREKRGEPVPAVRMPASQERQSRRGECESFMREKDQAQASAHPERMFRLSPAITTTA